MSKQTLYKILGIIFMLLILAFIVYPIFYPSTDDNNLNTNYIIADENENMLQIDVLSNLSFFKILVDNPNSEDGPAYHERFVTIRDIEIVEELNQILSTAKIYNSNNARGYDTPTTAICYLEDNSMCSFFVADTDLIVFSDVSYNKTIYKLDSKYNIEEFLTKLYNTNINSYNYSSFVENEKYGIKYGNKIIITPEYDNIAVINSKIDVFAVTQNKAVSFIDKFGENPFPNFENVEFIPAINGEETLWYENALKFNLDNKYGLLDLNGSILLFAEYDNIEALNYKKNFLILSQNGKKKLIKLTSSGFEELTGEFDSIKILGTNLDYNSYDKKYVYSKSTVVVGINNGIREQYFELE